MKVPTITAAGLLLALHAQAKSTLFSGTGFGTYYYDIEQPEVCSTNFVNQNTGNVMCSSILPLSLNAMDSNYIVAMNNTQLGADLALYCGKKVIVSVDGVPSDLPLFIGDGCERCGSGSASDDVWDGTGAPGLDFSYSVLNKLSSNACNDGHISITWEIVDETFYDFDTNAPGSTGGPVTIGDGGDEPDPSTSTPASTLSVQPEPVTPVVTTTPSEEPAPTPTTTTTTTTTSSSSHKPDPTTLVTTTTTPTPTTTTPGQPCETGAWQCDSSGKGLEQCLDDNWTHIVTCPLGLDCHGGDHPYCGWPSAGGF